MSKLSPSGQSMAALFSPEGEKLRAGQKEKAGAGGGPASSIRVPGGQQLGGGGKSQDSMGNPASPGYDGPLKKKASPQEAAPAQATRTETPKHEGYQSQILGPQFIRLGLGWDRILLAQKKLCDKAKGLFTKLEGPNKYRGQRRSSILEEKSRGAILDLDVEEEREKMDSARRVAEKKEKDAA